MSENPPRPRWSYAQDVEVHAGEHQELQAADPGEHRDRDDAPPSLLNEAPPNDPSARPVADDHSTGKVADAGGARSSLGGHAEETPANGARLEIAALENQVDELRAEVRFLGDTLRLGPPLDHPELRARVRRLLREIRPSSKRGCTRTVDGVAWTITGPGLPYPEAMKVCLEERARRFNSVEEGGGRPVLIPYHLRFGEIQLALGLSNPDGKPYTYEEIAADFVDQDHSYTDLLLIVRRVAVAMAADHPSPAVQSPPENLGGHE